jgi:hypothetical protein
MLDRKNFDMRQVAGMPNNVLVGINKDWLGVGTADPREVTESQMTMNPRLKDIIRAFASDHPDYIIEAKYAPYGMSGLDTFRFYFKGEQLGELSVSSSGKYSATSRVIRDGLERGSFRETKDRGKVLKLMRTFIPKSMDDRMSEAMQTIRNSVSREHAGRFEEYTHKYRNVCRYIERYVRDNWDTIAGAALAGGAPVSVLDAFFNSIEPYDTSKYINEAFENGKAVMVSIEGSVYCISNPPVNGTDPINKYTIYSNSERVPDHIRRGIGMLKLIESGYMAGVGYRASENKFIVLLGDGNE